MEIVFLFSSKELKVRQLTAESAHISSLTTFCFHISAHFLLLNFWRVPFLPLQLGLEDMYLYGLLFLLSSLLYLLCCTSRINITWSVNLVDTVYIGDGKLKICLIAWIMYILDLFLLAWLSEIWFRWCHWIVYICYSSVHYPSYKSQHKSWVEHFCLNCHICVFMLLSW
jgi:hypothetical protein